MSHSQQHFSHDEDLIKLREQFKGASKFLAKTRLNDKRSLTDLPWFILLGPAGAGKTSLLAHSEQEFILAKKSQRANLHALTSTQYCDWWATEQAVYVDLSGQFSHIDPDAAQLKHARLWREITRLLAVYYRQNKQLGVIIVISIPDLSNGREEVLAAAEAVRSQLQGLRQSLRQGFPIYLIVNKLDGLNGFSEFFYDLSREERSQTWSFSCNSAELDTINQRFDALLQKLNEQLLFRLQQQSQLNQRAKIHDFPMGMANLKPRLLEFMEHALPEKKGLIWRNVYFTSSATKSAADILNTSLAHLHASFSEPANKAQLPKAYFVENLLKQLNQQQLSQGLTQQAHAKSWSRRGAYLAAASIIILGASAWGYAFSRQLTAIHHTEQVLAKYEVMSESPQAKSIAEQIELLTILKQASDIPRAWFNAKKVRELRSTAYQTYQLALRKLLLPLLAKEFSAHLRSPVEVKPAQLYSALQAYLMLADAQHRQQSLLENLFIHFWQQQQDYKPELTSALHEHLQNLFATPLNPLPLEHSLIEAARLRLNQLPLAERSYTILHNLAWYPELNLYTSSSQIQVGISSFYTKQTLQTIYAKGLDLASQQAWSGDWVLGKLEDKPFDLINLDNLKAQVSDLYLADYAHHWQRVLREFSELNLGNPEETTELLEKLLYSDSTLNQALALIDSNTQITELTQGNSQHLTQRLVEKFASLHELLAKQSLWQALQIKIRKLQIYLLEIKLNGDMDEAAYNAAKTRLLSASASHPITDVREFAKQLPNPWQTWLYQLADNSWRYTLNHASSHLSQIWQQQVFNFYQQNIAKHFPFADLAQEDVNLEHFNKFFAPSGLLNEYFISLLKPFLNTADTHWQLKTLDNQGLNIKAESLAAIQQAAIIQRMFYPQQGDTPEVNYSLTTLAIDARIPALNLVLDDKTLAYPGKTESLNLTWRGEKSGYVKLNYQDKTGMHQLVSLSGPWSLFRFLAQGTLLAGPNPKQYVLALNANDNLLQFELEAREPINPFTKDLLTAFELPEHLG